MAVPLHTGGTGARFQLEPAVDASYGHVLGGVEGQVRPLALQSPLGGPEGQQWGLGGSPGRPGKAALSP